MCADPLDREGRRENGRKRGQGNTHRVDCPEEARLNALKKLGG
jgi:hypothetical protein